ncbi:uncharacterized protein LAJ45_01893 [Morchella importuna]|uniref:uncharacterized protein n=1 Tax=Morchella importuna TaxID=1174673 RepID=UPI001E8CAFB8|nr:uncharacterized protein LAJ45_01893 [Morchella importuna]KAH8154125.1 hypothetical protein LAJ45_01893 [Morchella importuna]
MDNFAQTGSEADVLFAAEVSPPQNPSPSAPTEPRAFPSKGSGNRGGGGGGGSGGRGGLQPRSVDQRNPPKEAKIVEGASEGPAAETKDAPKQQKQDRTLSGGLKKAKLTEEELTERMARAKLNNERLIERRRKAEEDENSFQVQEEARKQADATKRIVERKKKVEQERSRKELDDERAKNRQRKLNAVNSREWDSTKTEEDYNPRKGSSQFRRGAYGGVVDSTRGSPASRGFRGAPSGPRGSPGGPRGSPGAPRGAPSGPRGASGSNREAAASRGAPRNSNTTQEWPALPTASKDNASADTSTQAEAAPKLATPTNDQPTSLEGQPSTEEKTPAEGEISTEGKASTENNASSEVKAPEKSPAIGGLDTKYNVGDNLTPLSPAVGGDSWAEQVESAS